MPDPLETIDTPLPAELRDLDRPITVRDLELVRRELKGEQRAQRRQLEDLAADVRSNHEATIAALEGRTRVTEKIIDGFTSCMHGIGKFFGKLLERVTDPSKGFIALVAICGVVVLMTVGGLTANEVFDLGKMARELWTGDETTEEPAESPRDEPAPAPEPEPAPELDELTGPEMSP